VIFDKKIKSLILLGYKVFEVTLRTGYAFDVIQQIKKNFKAVKVFQAKVWGSAQFMKVLSEPYRTMKFMPTEIIIEAGCKDYLSLPSVYCVGGNGWVNKDFSHAIYKLDQPI
jgi:2-keto-3-deoxy-6-phosphogluconate aldolase